jgi:hypothetical protein
MRATTVRKTRGNTVSTKEKIVRREEKIREPAERTQEMRAVKTQGVDRRKPIRRKRKIR